MRQKRISIRGISVLLLASCIYSCHNNIYTKSQVDKVAEFSFGGDSLEKFIINNTKWVLNRASGKGYIVVGFTVDKTGDIKDINIVKTLFFSPFEKEAIRLVKIMPQWNPAVKNGKKVSSRVELPIRFEME